MRKKTYIIWRDWDGTYIKSFPATKDGRNLDANRFIGELNDKAESEDNYGTQIIAIISGEASYSIDETDIPHKPLTFKRKTQSRV
jgi:hypothetical protein